MASTLELLRAARTLLCEAMADIESLAESEVAYTAIATLLRRLGIRTEQALDNTIGVYNMLTCK